MDTRPNHVTPARAYACGVIINALEIRNALSPPFIVSFKGSYIASFQGSYIVSFEGSYIVSFQGSYIVSLQGSYIASFQDSYIVSLVVLHQVYNSC